MTTLPDPTSIDWGGIAAWGTGIGTVLGSIGAAVWFGVSRAMKVAEGLPEPKPTMHTTDVYTTDSVAMHELTNAIEAANVLATEGNALRREATDERRSLKEAMDENTAITEKSVANITELRNDIRWLTDAINRAGLGRP